MELTAKEIKMLENRRARKEQTARRAVARIAVSAAEELQNRTDKGLGGPFSFKGYKVIPLPDGTIQLWRKGVEVVPDMSALTDTTDAAPVEDATPAEVPA